MKSNDSKQKQLTPRRLASQSVKSRTTKSFAVTLDDLAEPLVTIPPDGGWGWVVVAVCSIIMFSADGIGFGFAIFFEEISKDMNCQQTEVAIVSSLTGGFYFLAGPITCSVINRFGFQMVAFLGGVLASIAFLAASFVNTLLPFLILVGFLGGTSFNLLYTPSIIALGFYFEKWRALAMAIACVGSALGVTSFPIMAGYIFGGLNWRIKFQILSAVLGVCGLLGLLLKPIKATVVERTVQFGDVVQTSIDIEPETESEVQIYPGVIANLFQRFKNSLFPTISEVSIFTGQNESTHVSVADSVAYSYYRPDDETLSTYIFPASSDSRELISNRRSILRPTIHEEEEIMIDSCAKCCDCFMSCCCDCCKKPDNASYSNVNRPLYRDDIFYSGSVYGLPQYSKHSRVASRISVPIDKTVPSLAYTMSVSRAPTQRDLEQHYQCVCCPEAVVRVLVTMLDFQMLTSPTFIVLLFSGYLSLMGTYIIFTYLPSYAIQKGIQPTFANYLLSVIGFFNALGRAACGVVSCFPVLDINIISWVTIMISGIMVISLIFVQSATELTIVAALFGFNLASFAVLRAIVFVDLFGLENLTNCFGLNMVFQSFAAFSATPIANLILSYTNSFKEVFLFTGISILVSGLILIPIKIILRWELRRKKKITFSS